MEQHFTDALRDRSLYLDQVGEFATIRCLTHTYELTPEAASDFVEQWHLERDDPSYRELALPFTGHIRAYPDDPADTEWVSTEGLDEVAERLTERFGRTYTWEARNVFGFGVEYTGYDGDWESDTTGLGEFRVGDTGWLIAGRYTEDESYRDEALASWTPADDVAARRATIIDTYVKEWASFEWAPCYGWSLQKCWGDLRLLLDCLVAVCMDEGEITSRHVSGSILFLAEHLERLDGVASETWAELGTQPPDHASWAALTADALVEHRSEPDFLRPFVAAYVAELAKGRPSNNDQDEVN